MNLINLFWPAILILGIITSYTDIRYGKIKNKTILFSIIYSLLAYFLLIFILKEQTTSQYLLQTTINIISALLIGYLMWDVGLWTAGDGKLFFAFATLIPLFQYNKASYIPFFPSMNILINTFIPIFLFFFIQLMFKTSLAQKKKSIKKALNPKKLWFLFLLLFSLSWVIESLFKTFNITLNYFFTIILFFIIIMPLLKLLPKHLYTAIGAICILRIIFDKDLFTIQTLSSIITLLLIFIFARYFLLDLGFIKFTTSVKIANLKPGMVPAEMIYNNNKKITKRKILFFSFFDYLKERNNNSLIDSKTEGLTKEDVKKIKTLAKKHPDLKSFQIQQTLPFAPYLFLGTILTIISHGNFFVLLKLIF